MGLSLSYKIDDHVEIDGEVYEVNAMFDVLLRVSDLTQDESISAYYRVSTALVFLLGTNEQIDRHLDFSDDYEFLEKYTIDERADILKAVLEKYVTVNQEVTYDLAGNRMTPRPQEDNHLDFEHDAEAIFASFMQAYKINLLEQQGKLHWFEFIALLNNLPDDTAISQIISLRRWDPSEDKKDYKELMKERQKKVALPERRVN